MPILRSVLIGVVCLTAVAGCNASGGGQNTASGNAVTLTSAMWGPADVSFAGLRYTGGSNSSCCGGAFTGMSVTESANMPTTGTATLTGVTRANINGDYRDGTSRVDVDFAGATVEVSGRVDFTGGSSGDGIVAYRQNAPLTGAHFQGAELATGDSVFGHFYGDDASVAAGSVNVTTATGQSMSGTFIAER